MKVTERIAYILNMAAKPGGSFVRVSPWSIHHWRFIRAYEYQRPGVEYECSAREIDKILAAKFAEIVERPDLGYGESDGKRSPARCAVITDEGRKALLASGFAQSWV